MKIALYGKPCSGKTTFANYLRDTHGFYKMDFTDLIKETVVDMLNFANLDITVEDVHKEKERFRPLLQTVAATLGFDEGYGVDQVIAKWVDAGCPQNVVFDNVRYMKQYERLVPYGFVLVELAVSNGQWQQRATQKGTTVYNLSEQMKRDMEEIWPDLILNGNGPVTHIAETLLRLGDVRPALKVPELEAVLTSGGDTRYLLPS